MLKYNALRKHPTDQTTPTFCILHHLSHHITTIIQSNKTMPESPLSGEDPLPLHAVHIGKMCFEAEDGRLVMHNQNGRRVCTRLRLLRATGTVRAFYGEEGMIQLELPYTERDVLAAMLAELADSCGTPHDFGTPEPTGLMGGTVSSQSPSSNGNNKYASLLSCFNLSNSAGVTKKSHSEMVRHAAVLRVHVPSQVSIMMEEDEAKQHELLQSRLDITRTIQDLQDVLSSNNKRDEARRVAVLAEVERCREARQLQVLQNNVAKQHAAQQRYAHRRQREGERNEKRMSAWQSSTHAARVGRICIDQVKADKAEMLERRRERSVACLNEQLHDDVEEFKKRREARTAQHSTRLDGIECFRDAQRSACIARLRSKDCRKPLAHTRLPVRDADRYARINEQHEAMKRKAREHDHQRARCKDLREGGLQAVVDARVAKHNKMIAVREAADQAYDARQLAITTNMSAKHTASSELLRSNLLRSSDMLGSSNDLRSIRHERAQLRQNQAEDNKQILVRRRELKKLARVLNDIGSDSTPFVPDIVASRSPPPAFVMDSTSNSFGAAPIPLQAC